VGRGLHGQRKPAPRERHLLLLLLDERLVLRIETLLVEPIPDSPDKYCNRNPLECNALGTLLIPYNYFVPGILRYLKRNNNRPPVDNTGRLLLRPFLFRPVLCSVCNNTDPSCNVVCKIIPLELCSNIFLGTLGNRSFISSTP